MKGLSTILQTAVVKEAMEALNNTPTTQIVFVVNSSQKVIGCITDGDIRRGLLRGESISSSVEKIMRKDFVAASKNTTNKSILNLMRSKGVRQIPVLDEQGRLFDVKLLDDLLLKRSGDDFPVVIMAGGKGSRLMPFTETVPKPMLKLGDRTLIERMVCDFQAKGVTEFYITVNYLAEKIVEHIGDGSKYGVQIEYIREPKPLGTAGSLSLLRGKLNRDFLLINGDVLSTVDLNLFSTYHREHAAIATVCAKLFTVNIPYGVVSQRDGNILSIDEKPDLSFIINSGIYFLSPRILDALPESEACDMPDLIERLIGEGKNVKCFQSTEPWIDVGSHGDFEKAQKYLEYFNT